MRGFLSAVVAVMVAAGTGQAAGVVASTPPVCTLPDGSKVTATWDAANKRYVLTPPCRGRSIAWDGVIVSGSPAGFTGNMRLLGSAVDTLSRVTVAPTLAIGLGDPTTFTATCPGGTLANPVWKITLELECEVIQFGQTVWQASYTEVVEVVYQ